MSKEVMTREEAALQSVADGNNKFAVRLYKELAKNKSGNLFVSPLSVQLVLALTYTGARGNTAKEMATLLSLPENIEDTFLGYSTIIKDLKGPMLKLASKMFVEATAGVKEEFQTNAEKHFKSPAGFVDFLNNTEGSRQKINTWVEDHTEQKIKDLIAPGVLDERTRLVLVNAIHFKAKWKTEFEEENTKKKPFYVSKTQTVPVQMMHLKRPFHFAYSKELKAKILALKYEGLQETTNSLGETGTVVEGIHSRMLVILPDEIDGLADLEEKLETVDLAEIVKEKNMIKPIVTVALPKFKLEGKTDFKQVLKTLGAASMFDEETANFSGLSDERLVVDQVMQKAFVDVNEKGTEAVAATFVMAEFTSVKKQPSRPPPEKFIADHPFVFFISHNSSNTMLFFGRYSSPE